MNQEPQSPGGDDIRLSKPPGRPSKNENSTEYNDPMQELFGPGSGLFHNPDDDESAPEELLLAFEEYDLGNQDYKCVLKEIGVAADKAIIKTDVGQYRSVDWITKNCGPGDYQLIFTWKTREGGKFKSNGPKYVRIKISDKCMDEYLDFQRKKKIANARQARQEIANAKLDKMLESDIPEDRSGIPAVSINPIEAGKRFVEQTLESAKLLGLNRQQNNGFDWSKILEVAATVLPIVFDFLGKTAERSEARMREFITLMSTMNTSNQAQMMEMIKTASGANAGQTAVQQYQDMLRGVIDIKQELGGMGKKSVADRVFELLEGLAPHVAALLAMKPQQAMSDPRMKLAQTYAAISPDVQTIKSDISEQTRLCGEMDAFYGWEQTDQILSIMRLFERPPTALRQPGQRYPADDPRNHEEIAKMSQEGAGIEPGSTQPAGNVQEDGEGLGED